MKITSKIAILLCLFACLNFVAFGQCNYIYVSTLGNNANDGSEGAPVQTLSQAISMVTGTRTHIRMAGGNYTEAGIINLANDVSVEGAYQVAGTVWTKSTTQVTQITFSGVETVSGVRHRIGFKANAISNWSLTDLRIITTTITGTDPSNRGSSNYGVWIFNCSNYTVSRCDITVGNASVGANGSTGSVGTAGSAGTMGGSGSCDGNYTCCFGSESAPGGTGGAGGIGAIGIAGGATNSSTTANINQGASGTGRNGGGGGAGGKGGGFSGGNASVGGSSGGGSASWGPNALYGGPGANATNPGGDGGNGGNGNNGVTGAVGAAGAAGNNAGGFFVPGVQAGTGADGTGGQGGAGGGGGGSQNCGVCNAGPGNGGSGGGGGGQGGTGGTGGYGGGSAYGIYRTGSNTGAVISQNTYVIGTAGAGGIGGAGGAGGSGGSGGARRTTCSSEIGEGGAGGNGGNGGAGGAGGAGAAGVAGQLCTDGAITSPSVAITIVPTTTARHQGCTNSEITLTKASGTWALPGGMSFINDLNSSASTYNTGSATAITGVGSTGFYTLTNGASSFNNFVLVTQTRALPSFGASMPTVICEGDNFNMSTTSPGIAYEWVIFDPAGSTAVPMAIFNTSVASWAPPVLGANANYRVRLRINDACCGWSLPVYFDFSVISSLVGPVGTGDVICENETASVSATGTGFGNLNWYSDPLGQNLLQSTAGTTSTYVTLPMSQTGVYYVSEGIAGCPGAMTAVQVTVNPAPVSPSASNEIFCAGEPVSLDATGTGGTLEWFNAPTGGAVLTSGATYNAGALAAGNYTYYVAENNGACSSQRTPVGATVNALPAAPTASPVSVCSGSPASLSATGTGTINWYSNVGLTNNVGVGSTYTTPPISSATTYYLTQTDANGCESTSASVVVTPASGVNPTIAITASDVSICNGTAVNFTSSITNGGATPVYNWYINGVSQASNTTTFNSSTLNDGDVVSATLVSNAACASPTNVTSNPVVISVVSSVTPTVSAQAVNSSICAGETAMFTGAITNGGSNPAYQWYLNGNPVGSNSNIYSTNGLLAGDLVTLELTSSESCATVATVTSTPAVFSISPSVTPSMAIAASTNTICAGTAVNFTSTTSNGGATPIYDWFVNGVSQANNAITFASSTLANGDVISATLVSDASCATPANATSNSIVMTVNAPVTPTVSAQASATSICAGDNVLFTGAITNGGSNPAYQWFVNGSPVGSNSSVYTSSTIANGDNVTLQLTSSEVCATTATVTSAPIAMTVNTTAAAGISIAASTLDICSGTAVNFTATPINGGATPSYEWYVNGIAQSTNNVAFSSSTLNDGDMVTATMVSSLSCANPTNASSNNISINVNPSVVPTVAVNASTTAICAGETVTFSATSTNGGSAPVYQWYLNGSPVGANSQVYVNSTLVNGDQVSVELTSSEVCATPATATSSTITMNTSSTVVPFAFISADQTDLCAGEAVTVSSNIVNGGTTPGYDWYLNGVSTGQTGTTYNSTTLTGGDVLTLILTSSSACATPSIISSNSINFTSTSTTPAVVSLSYLSPNLCEGQDVIFVASPNNAPTVLGYIWNLNGNVVGTSGSVYNGIQMAAGDQVSVTLQYNDLCGTFGTALSNTITISPNPVVDAGTGGAISLGDSIQLNGSTSIPGGYVWSPSASLSDDGILNPWASPEETTTYVLTAVTDMGCQTSDTVTVIVSDENDFDLVNSFTPNDDGTNDTWVIHNLDLYPNFTLAIYNRWGLLLYEQSSSYTPWDGTYKGNPLPSDTYFYVLQLDSTLDPINGSVTIVR